MVTRTRKKSMEVRQRCFWFNEPHNKPLPLRKIFVDGFAGGGGASHGIRVALGRDVDVAINHDRDAISMHMANHPQCKHYCENIYDVDPDEVCEGRCIAGAWFSPDCTHHSRARGSKPVKKEIRGLAQSIIRWADMDRERRPRVIYVENVSEFQDWGPTIAFCKKHKATEIDIVNECCPTCGGTESIEMPDKARKGETFRLWVAKLEELGYVVEWRELTASDYGAPTTRKRLFVVARCDGRPIVWPEPTHAKPDKIAKEIKAKGSSSLLPWRTAAEIIDWSIECPSIFLSASEAKAAGCRRPLAEKTLARIAKGIERYVINTTNPFIVRVNHGGEHWRGQTLDKPLGTVTNSNGFALVTPTIVSYYGPKAGDESSNHRGRSIDEPLPTVTTENRFGIVSAFLASTANQGTTGRAPYCWPAEEPLRTLTTTGDKVVVSASISRMFGGSVGTDCESPVGTTTAENKSALVTAFLAKHFGGMVGIPADRPFPTVTTVGTQNQLVTANLIKMNHGDKQAFAADEPLKTVMSGANHHGLVLARIAEVRGFLFRYFGSGGQWSSADAPTPTITTKDRLALGIVMIGETPWQIIDIGMRMLTPRELFLAQGFPSTYHIETGEDGRPLSKSAQVARCGNSVPPQFATALVRANQPEICTQ